MVVGHGILIIEFDSSCAGSNCACACRRWTRTELRRCISANWLHLVLSVAQCAQMGLPSLLGAPIVKRFRVGDRIRFDVRFRYAGAASRRGGEVGEGILFRAGRVPPFGRSPHCREQPRTGSAAECGKASRRAKARPNAENTKRGAWMAPLVRRRGLRAGPRGRKASKVATCLKSPPN